MAVLTRVSSPSASSGGARGGAGRLGVLLEDVLAGGSACAVVAGEAGLGKTRLVSELLGRPRTSRCWSAAASRSARPCCPTRRSSTSCPTCPAAGHGRGPRSRRPDRGRALPAAARRGRRRAPNVTRASASRLSRRAPHPVHRPRPPNGRCSCWSRTCTGPTAPPATCSACWRGDSRPARSCCSPPAPTSPTSSTPSRFLAQLSAAGAHRIELRPFTRDEQALQLSGIVGIPPTAARLDQVYARAEGNPFFAEELVALGDADVVPVTVRDLLEARVEALPPSTRRVVRGGRGGGRRWSTGCSSAPWVTTDQALDDALRPAIEALRARRRRGQYVVPARAAARDGAASLLPGERSRLHRRLAETLTERPALADSRHGLAGRIAHHWLAAGDAAAAAGRPPTRPPGRRRRRWRSTRRSPTTSG